MCSRVVRRRQEVATDWENNHRRGRFWGARRVVAWERADRRTVEKKSPERKGERSVEAIRFRVGLGVWVRRVGQSWICQWNRHK